MRDITSNRRLTLFSDLPCRSATSNDEVPLVAGRQAKCADACRIAAYALSRT
jgi:hypothetical protein